MSGIPRSHFALFIERITYVTPKEEGSYGYWWAEVLWLTRNGNTGFFAFSFDLAKEGSYGVKFFGQIFRDIWDASYKSLRSEWIKTPTSERVALMEKLRNGANSRYRCRRGARSSGFCMTGHMGKKDNNNPILTNFNIKYPDYQSEKSLYLDWSTDKIEEARHKLYTRTSKKSIRTFEEALGSDICEDTFMDPEYDGNPLGNHHA